MANADPATFGTAVADPAARGTAGLFTVTPGGPAFTPEPEPGLVAGGRRGFGAPAGGREALAPPAVAMWREEPPPEPAGGRGLPILGWRLHLWHAAQGLRRLRLALFLRRAVIALPWRRGFACRGVGTNPITRSTLASSHPGVLKSRRQKQACGRHRISGHSRRWNRHPGEHRSCRRIARRGHRRPRRRCVGCPHPGAREVPLHPVHFARGPEGTRAGYKLPARALAARGAGDRGTDRGGRQVIAAPAGSGAYVRARSKPSDGLGWQETTASPTPPKRTAKHSIKHSNVIHHKNRRVIVIRSYPWVSFCCCPDHEH